MKLIKSIFAAGLVLGFASTANAASISFSDEYPAGASGGAVATTNWTQTLTVSQFDASLGPLQSVSITLEGLIDGTGAAESEDGSPSVITLELGVGFTADLSALTIADLVVDVAASDTFNATAFDGVIDFAGTSGISGVPLSGSDTGGTSTSNAADLALFTGLGTISFDITADGQSTATGAGNVISQFATNGGAILTVTYNYGEIPAPAPLALLALGMLGIARARRAK